MANYTYLVNHEIKKYCLWGKHDIKDCCNPSNIITFMEECAIYCYPTKNPTFTLICEDTIYEEFLKVRNPYWDYELWESKT